MNIPVEHTQVLIVGAGPSGLMMAAQLLRYGIQPVIIDNKQGPTNQSKALAVQARSLEIYRQMGIDERIVKDGKHAGGALFNVDGKEAARFNLNDMGDASTAFPYIHLYPQSKNERLLLDYLTQHCCPVYWETTLTDIARNDGQTKAKLDSKQGPVTLNCDWVIGADGARSIVRKLLEIPFKGDTYPHLFYLLDAELGNKFDDDYIRVFLTKDSLAGFFQLPEAGNYRIIGNLPEQFNDKPDLQMTDVLPFLNKVTGFDILVKENNWFTTYKLHHRMADQFRGGRCFLVGDAAHIHSPVGGQGMNTGLQDAYNLAWKLAGVINGKLREDVLDSYEAERIPVARKLLKSTDRVFNLITSGNLAARLVKKYLLPRVLKFAWSKPAIRHQFFLRVSQTDISYRDSKINLHLSQAQKIKAGDRLPYLKVYDEKKQQETDLHAWCTKPGFNLIIFGKFTEERLFQFAKWLTTKYPGCVNFFYLPYSIKNHMVFDAFELTSYQAKAIIVRPDMHIGYMNDIADIPQMDNYLQNVAGLKVQPPVS